MDATYRYSAAAALLAGFAVFLLGGTQPLWRVALIVLGAAGLGYYAGTFVCDDCPKCATKEV